ncbi:MAG: lysylphosphatidylglycerol synthase transmembrane domain-containing protein, partial [Candidatus Binatia bacterium]
MLVYLFRRVDFGETATFLANIDRGWLVVAMALYLAGQALSAVKWRRLASAVGFSGGVGRFVTFYFIGTFFNAFGFGTVGGDVIRALYLAGAGGRRVLALNTVLADRVSGLLVLLAVALASMLLFRTYELPATLYWGTVGLSAALLGGWRLLPVALPRLFREDNRLRRL